MPRRAPSFARRVRVICLGVEKPQSHNKPLSQRRMAVYKAAILACMLLAVILRFPLLGPIVTLPFVLLATPPDFVIRAGLLLGLVLLPEWLLGPARHSAVPTLTAYLLCLLVLAWAYAARERLVAPAEDPIGRWVLAQFGGLHRTLIAASAIVIFLLVYFPSPGPYPCILVLFCMALVRRRLPETHGTRETRWHAILDASLLTACVLICILIVELGLRMMMLPPVGMRAMLQPHPKYLFMLMPNRVSRQTFNAPGEAPYVLTYETSSQGFVDREYGPKKPDEFRILLLGDSMMMGYGVEMPYSIPRHLDRLLAERVARTPFSEISVINAGCAAGGPLQELGILRERGLPLDPDLVILQIVPSSDVQDALMKPLRAYDPNWFKSRQKILRQTQWRQRAHWWLTRNSYLYERITVLCDNPNLLPDIIESSWLFPGVPDPKPPPPENRPFWLEPDLAQWYPDLQQAMDQLCGHILAMRDACRARGVDFVAYPIPCHNEFNVEQWAVCQENLPPGYRYERYRAERYLYQFLRQNEIPTLSVIEPLENYPDPEALVMPDSHLSSIGNRIVALRLMEYLGTHYLRPKVQPKRLSASWNPAPASL